MIISVCGSDRISIGMFFNFLKIFGLRNPIITLHSLMSKEVMEKNIEKHKSTGGIIISYYDRNKGRRDPAAIAPTVLLDISDIVIWFNRYDLNPVILKDEQNNFQNMFFEKWNKFSAIGGK